jgi:mono/diheme cytochrome c family protein
MRRSRASTSIFILGALLLLWGCDYERMKETEGVRTYEVNIPEMPQGTIPLGGGVQELREADPRGLRNPLPSTPQIVERGRERYGFYCVMCHGPKADGNGTVGQSFAPLPTDLRGRSVEDQADGELFQKISLGFRRHPPLAATVAEQDRWAIIHYIRSLTPRS